MDLKKNCAVLISRHDACMSIWPRSALIGIRGAFPSGEQGWSTLHVCRFFSFGDSTRFRRVKPVTPLVVGALMISDYHPCLAMSGEIRLLLSDSPEEIHTFPDGEGHADAWEATEMASSTAWECWWLCCADGSDGDARSRGPGTWEVSADDVVDHMRDSPGGLRCHDPAGCQFRR